MHRRAGLAVLILGLAAGCSATNAARQQARAECARLYAAPALESIRSKMILGNSEAVVSPPLALLSDPSRPSPDELVALHALDATRRACQRRVDAASPPAGYTMQARVRISAALADLIAGTSTWGQFNRERAKAIADLMEARDRARALESAASSGSQAAPVVRPQTCRISGIPPFQRVDCD